MYFYDELKSVAKIQIFSWKKVKKANKNKKIYWMTATFLFLLKVIRNLFLPSFLAVSSYSQKKFSPGIKAFLINVKAFS